MQQNKGEVSEEERKQALLNKKSLNDLLDQMLVLEKSKKAKSEVSQVALGDDFVHTKILDGEGRVVGATFQEKVDAETNTEMDLIEPILEAIRQRNVL